MDPDGIAQGGVPLLEAPGGERSYADKPRALAHGKLAFRYHRYVEHLEPELFVQKCLSFPDPRKTYLLILICTIEKKTKKKMILLRKIKVFVDKIKIVE